jgi:bacterioferritin-associated ferredoxin
MYICVCSGVTEKQIVEAVAKGARCLKDLRHQLNVTRLCGRCAACAKQSMHGALQDCSHVQCNLAEAL